MKQKTIQTAMLCTALVGTYCNTLLHAAPAEVPQTGQTATSPVDPAPDGSDGAVQAGAAWPSPRFTEVTDGCVDDDFMIQDNLTGLMWLGNADDYNTGDDGSSDPQVWNDALSGVDSFNYCGHDDWRLPNIVELKSLLNLGQGNQADWLNNPDAVLNDGSDDFDNIVGDDSYWSSSAYAPDPDDFAWFVNMINSGVSAADKEENLLQVLPVRRPVGN